MPTLSNPSSGAAARAYKLGPTYTAYKSGSSFKAMDADGNVLTSSTNPKTLIEAAWTALGVLGGGTLLTKGAGETWTIPSQIASQAAKVTWFSDWSLKMILANNVDANMVQITHDYVNLDGLYLDGNGDNQTHGAQSGPEVVEFHNADYGNIRNSLITNGCTYGIAMGGTAAGDGCDHGTVGPNNLCMNSNWNQIITAFGNHCKTIGNTTIGGGDVGISCWDVDDLLIEGNVISDVTGASGYNNSGNGIAVEYDSDGVDVVGNHIRNVKTGIVFGGAAAHNVIDSHAVGNRIRECSVWGIAMAYAEDCGANSNSIRDMTAAFSGSLFSDTTSIDCSFVGNKIKNTTQTNRYGVKTYGDNTLVVGNTFKNCSIGVYADDGDDLQVTGNKFITCVYPAYWNSANVVRPLFSNNTTYGCTNDSSIAGATNERTTDNIDKAGAWWVTGDSPA